MALSPEPSISSGRSPRHRWLAIAAILAVTLLRLAYLYFACPYDLAPDEAHYWDWSRHLDWSYYSKGPLIAWIIRGACEMFGPAALATDGTLMPAIRTPAVLCASAMLIALFTLTFQTYHSDRLALGVVLVGLTIPAFTACSILMTIDAPFLACWSWALVFGRSAAIDGKAWAWPAAGTLVALGILAKPTMALWPFSVGLFVLFTPTHRRLLTLWSFWSMALVGAMSAIPILIWNSQHDWVTFRHVAVQAGVAESAASGGIHWKGLFEYVGGQFALLLGYWFVVWVVAVIRARPHRGIRIGLSYLWWMSVPTFVVFAVSSLLKSGQINWPVAAYLSGGILVAGWVRKILTQPDAKYGRRSFVTAVAIGLAISLLALNTRLWTVLANPFLPQESESQLTPGRLVDPAARLKGWRQLGAELDVLRNQVIAAEGLDPVLAGLRWDVPGLLGLYTSGHPQAYSLGLHFRLDRHSQYDLWRPNPGDDAQAFAGRTFLVVWNGDPSPVLRSAFESVSPPHEVVYRENGLAIARWYVCVCRGYRGIDPVHGAGTQAGH